jgi:hypothetical protein
MADTTTPKKSPKPALATVWQHLDAICVGTEPAEQNLLTQARQATQAVIYALMTPGPIDRTGLSASLKSAVNHLRLAGGHLDDAVWVLGEVSHG